VLISNTMISGLLIILFATIGVGTPVWLIVAQAFVFGFFTSLQYTSMNTLVYADVTEEQASSASTIASTMQQMSISFGVAAASLATAFFIPDRFHTSAPEMIHGIHQAFLVLGGLTIPHGLPRVQAICDWVHNNIEYRFGSGRPDLSASEVIERRHGVCRDFAHAAIALCRAFNLPARYVTGHLPDIGYVDPGTPMDFHAYCEVYLGQEWLTFDRATMSRALAASKSPTARTRWTARLRRSTARPT
jgi:MFS family permease